MLKLLPRAIKLYSVEGAPPGKDIPFVVGYKATPDVVLEPWMAMVSRDGKKLAATVSKPGLFLFQNSNTPASTAAPALAK